MDDLPLQRLQLLVRSLSRCDFDAATREWLWQLLEDILDGTETTAPRPHWLTERRLTVRSEQAHPTPAAKCAGGNVGQHPTR